MPVFDFNDVSDERNHAECTYTTFRSDAGEAAPEQPILLLDNHSRQWKHHSIGVFTNPVKRSSFEFEEEDGKFSADIVEIDARFVSLLRWLGENHINVRLSGKNREDGYAVYKIREIAFGGGTKLSAEDGFLQFMMDRLFASHAPEEIEEDEDYEEVGDEMKLTSLQSIDVYKRQGHERSGSSGNAADSAYALLPDSDHSGADTENHCICADGGGHS